MGRGLRRAGRDLLWLHMEKMVVAEMERNRAIPEIFRRQNQEDWPGIRYGAQGGGVAREDFQVCRLCNRWMVALQTGENGCL